MTGEGFGRADRMREKDGKLLNTCRITRSGAQHSGYPMDPDLPMAESRLRRTGCRLNPLWALLPVLYLVVRTAKLRAQLVVPCLFYASLLVLGLWMSPDSWVTGVPSTQHGAPSVPGPTSPPN